MHTFQVKVGRLVEMRLETPISIEDIERIRSSLSQLFQQRSGKIVCVTDWRRATAFTPGEADLLLETFKVDNPRIERSAFLIDLGVFFHRQVERIISQAKNPARRAFQDPDELKAFLVTSLTDAEHGQLSRFLSGKS